MPGGNLPRMLEQRRRDRWQAPLDGSAPKRLTEFDEHTLFWFAPLRTGTRSLGAVFT